MVFIISGIVHGDAPHSGGCWLFPFFSSFFHCFCTRSHWKLSEDLGLSELENVPKACLLCRMATVQALREGKEEWGEPLEDITDANLNDSQTEIQLFLGKGTGNARYIVWESGSSGSSYSSTSSLVNSLEDTEVLQWLLLPAAGSPRALGSNTKSISMLLHALCTLHLRPFQSHTARIQK